MKLLILLFIVSKLHVNGISFLGKHQNLRISKEKEVINSLYKSNSYVTEEWFTQTLDHFNLTDTRTWKQRFQVNYQHYNYSSNGSSVFLFIGAEEKMTLNVITGGAWMDYAKELGALCFQLEHRYYGQSHPTKDMSTENLKYLNSEQALADLAMFVGAMNMRYGLPANTKWIAFGASYGGSLAAWLRLKYPHLIHGAVSSSAPLVPTIDFSDYFRVVVESLKSYSDKCVNNIKEAREEIDRLLKNGGNELKNLNDKFLLCDPIENSINKAKDIANLYIALADSVGGIVQMNNNAFFYIDKNVNLTIQTICDKMENQKLGSPIDRLAVVNRFYLYVEDNSCLDYKYEKMINSLKNVTWDEEKLYRQWNYQKCTEFAYFHTLSRSKDVFGDHFPVEFGVKKCMDIYGPNFNATFIKAAVDRTNVIYGGLDIDVTNVVFVHGSLDPWHTMGLLRSKNPKTPVIIINGTSHMADTYPASDRDLPQLKSARKQIVQYIKQWIDL